MELSCAGASDVGRTRAANEDFFATDLRRGLFVIADGLGGHVAGRVASETAVESFMKRAPVAAPDDPLGMLRACARAANADLLARVAREPDLKGMATTLAALWLRGSAAALVHLGDSRIYMLRGAQLHPLTMDHSYVTELVFRRRMDAALAKNHPHRNVILRALGVLPAAEPDVCTFEALPGDLFLLCTDGIHGQLSDADIRSVLARTAADVESAAHALVELANERGGHDNATAVLVLVR